VHLDEGIKVSCPINVGNIAPGASRPLPRRRRQGGLRQAASWRKGAPERRSRPRPPEGEASQLISARAGGRLVITALLALALLSCGLLIVFPQPIEPVTLNSFAPPTAAVAASHPTSPRRQGQQST
jgi:hypothetical protein